MCGCGTALHKDCKPATAPSHGLKIGVVRSGGWLRPKPGLGPAYALAPVLSGTAARGASHAYEPGPTPTPDLATTTVIARAPIQLKQQ